jgi:hypothetical protein
MPFFKELRRRSKATFHKTPTHSVEEVSGKSSSTIDTTSHNSITPPSSIRPTLSTPSLPALSESDTTSALSTPVPPQRQGHLVANSQRNSVIVRTRSSSRNLRRAITDADHLAIQGSSSSSVNGVYRSQAPVSPYAPRLVSVADNSWVCAAKAGELDKHNYIGGKHQLRY